VLVYAGVDPLTGKAQYLTESTSSETQARKVLTRLLGQVDERRNAHSGGSTHALAAAALLGDRVSGVLAISALAPFDAEGLDWFAGMSAAGEGSLRAAAEGHATKERYEATSEEDDPGFTDADNAMFSGPWSWFLTVVRPEWLATRSA
jgi:pimeloyl-ACP methyl ester carboxylesterase